MDAMGRLEEKIASLGSKTVGYWPADSYDCEASLAIHDDNNFYGLGLDNDNESKKTGKRSKTWAVQIKKEM